MTSHFKALSSGVVPFTVSVRPLSVKLLMYSTTAFASLGIGKDTFVGVFLGDGTAAAGAGTSAAMGDCGLGVALGSAFGD
jgi:hypothetical protein